MDKKGGIRSPVPASRKRETGGGVTSQEEKEQTAWVTAPGWWWWCVTSMVPIRCWMGSQARHDACLRRGQKVFEGHASKSPPSSRSRRGSRVAPVFIRSLTSNVVLGNASQTEHGWIDLDLSREEAIFHHVFFLPASASTFRSSKF